jgi:hypothetical protein
MRADFVPDIVSRGGRKTSTVYKNFVHMSTSFIFGGVEQGMQCVRNGLVYYKQKKII